MKTDDNGEPAPKKKRGRPPKAKAAEGYDDADEVMPEKKKRGRPPKSAAAAPAAEPATVTAT